MKIKVHIQVNWSVTSSARIVLEKSIEQENRYYILYRGNQPRAWSNHTPHTLGNAHSEFIFEIEADPEEIHSRWQQKYKEWKTDKKTHNCADAAQWFLTQYANIPAPAFYSVPLSINHLLLGLPMPSILPCPFTLPGRVMDNARFHILSRTQSRQEAYKNLITGLIATVALTGLIIAGSYLTGGLLLGIIVALGCYGLYHSINQTAMGFFKINPCQSPASSQRWDQSISFSPAV